MSLLHPLAPGSVTTIFGILVVILAAMLHWVIDSAEKTLAKLENSKNKDKKSSKKKKGVLEDNLQLSFYQLDDPLLMDIKEKLKSIDINSMSPLDAFDTIRALKKQIGL